ncbi:hypothetical protein [Fluviispira sanaruensis]|uniref:Lysozyme inhibitor LprI N-terminal domain-containing protein n=1 Tax=Fluviispira sanaruensis TaxID=2493639 RepID=A0A4P2VHU0_FLUSA|nr:hypothetical protein [Fluviispira sanaruensis]BBH52516.1 hypothetical protein JCM31447_09570 [Fluviispira sanaruensis]
MIKLIKMAIVITPILFVTNSFSQEMSMTERNQIEQDCNASNQRNMEILRAYGNRTVSAETLLQKCINSRIEISIFNSYNTIENTQELYSYTVSALENKLAELQNINTPESILEYKCLEKQKFAIEFATLANESFLKRALITANNLLRFNCDK